MIKRGQDTVFQRPVRQVIFRHEKMCEVCVFLLLLTQHEVQNKNDPTMIDANCEIRYKFDLIACVGVSLLAIRHLSVSI